MALDLWIALAALTVPGTTPEVEVIDHVIRRGEENLHLQKELRKEVAALGELRDRFAKGESSKEHVWNMVKTAKKVLDLIEQEHLAHLFSDEYLEELKFFSSFVEKQTITRD